MALTPVQHAEGKRLYRSDRKQVFYYDDFLGQTFLGDQRWYVGRNQDAALLNFMEMVRETGHSCLVLTTREHILSQAMQASERLQHSAALTYKCILQLGDYSIGQRARILYNHLYFSDLPLAYKEAVLRDDFFLRIIKHAHFNPRLIEWLTTLTRLNSPPPARYCESISELLESPERIWSHAFSTQISDAARNLLLVVYSMGEWVDTVDHAEAFDALHRASAVRFNRSWSADDFRSALRETDGSFLRYSSGRASFLNPSIKDFTASVIGADPSAALALIESAVRFKQLQNVWNLAVSDRRRSLVPVLKANASSIRFHAQRLMKGSTFHVERIEGRFEVRTIDIAEEQRLEQLVEWAEALEDQVFVDLAAEYSEWMLSRWAQRTVSFRYMADVLVTMSKAGWFMDHRGRDTCRMVLEAVLLHLDDANAADWTSLLELPREALSWTPTDEALFKEGFARYRNEGLDQERSDCSDVSDLADLNSNLKELEEKYELGLTAVIRSIEAEIDGRERDRPEPDEGGGFSSRSVPIASDQISDADVRDMFSTLLS